ncbi:hypothetical protein PR048_014054 [Dryococelus australis]|uniref:HAT C-terminal dimerisation domain-containing protein n=1 Tax=Dryococelus australis TaxID=614101 RepID=A0ABQ9HTX5_9NEOP|nr:hypothetical protein PR048_014054 [Dryococelus australis]
MNLINFRATLPKTEIKSENDTVIREIVNIYQDFIEQSATFITIKQEFSIWVQKWKRVGKNKEKLPYSVLETLEKLRHDMYASIHKLVRIMAKLSVSAATAERIFSTLGRLKTWRRASIGKERLAGSALMSVDREIPLDPEAIILRCTNAKSHQEIVF